MASPLLSSAPSCSSCATLPNEETDDDLTYTTTTDESDEAEDTDDEKDAAIHKQKRQKNKKLKSLLKDVSKINLTTDIWKSDNQNIEFMVITGHFIDSNWKLQKRILGVLPIPPCPSCRIDMSGAMYKCLTDWEIENEIFTVSVENSTDNDRCLRILRENSSTNKKLIIGGNLFHIQCCASMLNSLVQKGLGEIEGIVDNLEIGARKLIFDCPTRWNSTLDMLSTALKFKVAFSRFKERDSHPSYENLPQPEEWEQVDEVCELLELFRVATNMISSSNYPTSNLYLPEICRVKEVLNLVSENGNDFIRAIGKKMREKFDAYWDESNLLMAVASVLDPRCKLLGVEWCLSKIYPEAETARQVEKVWENINDIYGEYFTMKAMHDEKASFGVAVSFGGSTCSTSQSSLISGWTSLMSYMKQTVHMDKLELDTYLKADILPIPLCTVAAESMFSAGSRVVGPYLASLAPETAQALICGGDWLRNLLGVKKKRHVEDLEEMDLPIP
ncbi:zinc finger BED domain-containing protein RICESLEEPER 2-like [Quillaja saponaria]|uniref:Zinc finger BED domain-containing protein RICESLEEPER 2-like n=1 Tax=Quillaja saponaria TaxID=32244 RepID=A0AAD7VNI2_QUISA|nr:zinc finger BED domain-containing protein RICESLEEPER 2-like [Quillaja saponaria]